MFFTALDDMSIGSSYVVRDNSIYYVGATDKHETVTRPNMVPGNETVYVQNYLPEYSEYDRAMFEANTFPNEESNFSRFA